MAYDIIVGRNASDKKKLGNRGLTYLGKGYVKMGQYTSLSNKIFMDIARSHVVLVAGKRGSGKSYTLGVIAEELANLPEEIGQNIGSLIFDTMGIYWTMKYSNEKDKELLKEWGLKSQNLPVKVFVPFGHYEDYLKKGIPVDESFALDIREMTPEDWIITFELSMTNPISVLITRTLSKLNEEENYTIKDIIKHLESDSKTTQETKNAAVGLFEAANNWGIFAKSEKDVTKVKDLVTARKTTIMDLSVYNSIGAFNVRALVISLITRKIFNQRMESRKKEEIVSIAKGMEFSQTTEKKSRTSCLVDYRRGS